MRECFLLFLLKRSQSKNTKWAGKTEQLTTLDGMNWIQRKIYLYNVTFGLYMLDWWERYLFNTLVVVLMWFIFYNSSRYVTDFCRGFSTQQHKNMVSDHDFCCDGIFISTVLMCDSTYPFGTFMRIKASS
ncbi:uncharacterized protein [Primulina eburnea]|uniref:uncharacterized protein isoform X1 n=1 Tax=Primulina eburnea TaxID=1245227 RepID=UPI003C6CAAF1